MYRLFALVGALLLFACETPAGLSYYGKDAGWLVVGIGSEPGAPFQTHSLQFRSKGPRMYGIAPYRGFAIYVQNTPLQDSAKDFDDESARGIVAVVAVRPGDYEFFNFRVGLGNTEWVSEKDFSIPFTIRTGRATYVGDFKAAGLRGENFLGQSVPAGAYFLFADRRMRDIPIAKKKVLGIEDVDFFVPNIERIGNPLLRPAPR